jgi:hypothetical protein
LRIEKFDEKKPKEIWKRGPRFFCREAQAACVLYESVFIRRDKKMFHLCRGVM